MDLLSLPDKIRLLSDNGISVYLLMHSLCFKGSRCNVPREIKTNGIAKTLGLTYKQTRLCIDKIVGLGLLEKWSTTFKQQHGTQQLWTKTAYYRLPQQKNTP